MKPPPVVVRADPGTYPHGDRRKYVLERCRCDACRVANREYASRQNRLKAYGKAGNIASGEARAHVIRLLNTGMGVKRIADAAGVSHNTVSILLNGRKERGTPPPTSIRKITHDRILAVKAGFRPRQLIPARRTWEQIADLMALGYSRKWIAEQMGNRHALQIDRRNVEVATALKVDRLWQTTSRRAPEENRWQVSAAARSRNAAERVRAWARKAQTHVAPTRHRTGRGSRRVAA